MRISDWSSDVCSSDLVADRRAAEAQVRALNADLENRIRARTAELEATNRQLRREVEERRNADRRFRDVASLSVDWIWETDADLAYTFMSDRVERVTGLPPSGYIGQSRIVMFGDPAGDYFLQQHRSYARRVGKGCVSTCRSRWSHV